jgi:hypothetical protein
MKETMSWQRACSFLIFIIVVQALFTHFLLYGDFRQPNAFPGQTQSLNESTLCPATEPVQCPPMPEAPRPEIKFNLHGEIADDLSADQCHEQFPNLYYEVDRATSYWRDRDHQISADDLDVSWRSELKFPNEGGALRVLIHDNELRVVESRMTHRNPAYRARGISFLSLLNAAVRSATAGGERLPTIEAAIVLEDIVDYPDPDSTHSIWTWTANMSEPTHDRHWLIPNFDFYGAGNIGSYEQARRRAVAQDSSWTSKIPQIVWRGTPWYNPFIRGHLLEATKDKPWADVKSLDWVTKDTYMTVDQMCKYAMTAHTEGGSYSGRLKFLLNCDSLTIIHDLAWRTYFVHLLVDDGPGQNFVAVERDFSDLEEKVEYFLEHPEEAETIVGNAVATFRDRYLAPAAQSCYIRKLIQGYSTVADTPEVYRPLKEGHTVPMRRGRGFEDWLQGGEDYTEEEDNK